MRQAVDAGEDMMEETLEAVALLEPSESDEFAEYEDDRLALLAEEFREAIRRKIGSRD